jgi:hypothetical protein
VIEGMEGADGNMLLGFGIIVLLLVITLGYLMFSGNKSEKVYDEKEYL